MTLFAIPFTCSLAVRLVLAERAEPPTLRWMRRFEHRLDDGAAYDQLNPKRRVPAIGLPDGRLLTEIVAILDRLDRATPRAEADRQRHLEWLAYLATELHRPPMVLQFDPATPPEVVRDMETRVLPPVLAYLDGELSQRPTLLGDEVPSPADFYLFWALTLLRFRGTDGARTPALDAFYSRIAARPLVREVLRDERAEMGRWGVPQA